jgi:hypothetical protein
MVSLDHFKHELTVTLRQAHLAGAIDLIVNSTEFVGFMRRGESNVRNCCEAMSDEMKMGDVLEQEQPGRAGLTIRYQLPRTSAD